MTKEEYLSVLKWRNLVRKDSGIIEIQVKNQYGSDTAKIELVVFGELVFVCLFVFFLFVWCLFVCVFVCGFVC